MVRRGSVAVVALALLATMLHGTAAASPAPGELAVVRTATGGQRVIMLVDEAGQTLGELVDLGDRDAIQPSWSPDGRTLVFSAQISPGGPFAIYTYDVASHAVQQVSFPEGASGPAEGDFSPAWSPDGIVIAFARAIGTSSKIFVQLVGSLTAERVTADPWAFEVEPAWMPDSPAIVFANRAFQEVEPGTDPGHPAYHFQIVRANLTWPPRFATNITAEWNTDFRTPDVSPDGTTIAAAATLYLGDPPPTVSAFFRLDRPGLQYQAFPGERNPDFSPDGSRIAADFLDAGFAVVSLVGGGITSPLPGADAAWRPPERTPPAVTFAFDTAAEGWLDGPVLITATDVDSAILRVDCTLDGAPVQLSPGGGSDPHVAIGKLFLEGLEGEPTLACSATDAVGNVGSASVVLLVDSLAPRLGTPIVTSPRSVQQPVDVSVAFEEHGSGLIWATLELRSETGTYGGPMSVTGDTLTGSLVVPAGIYDVVVGAADRRGNESSVSVRDGATVVDPAGSVSGTGWIVPGGGTSDTGDNLPGLDGRTKASFSLSAKYRKPSSVTPTGSFSLSFGSSFRLQSTDLAWLVVAGSSATLQGTAEVRGISGELTFRVVARDGRPDHLLLRVWGAPAPFYQASGDVGGQIQVRS